LKEITPANKTKSSTASSPFVWINGVPKGWNDNFFVRKKLMNAIKSRFDNINIKELKKDNSSQKWLLFLDSTDIQILDQSLIVEEGTTKHTLTFTTSN